VEFTKYQHVERFGTVETEGIELGDCVVFPKLDGANGSVWLGDDGAVKAGSRNRELTLDNDNQGFYAYVLGHDGLIRHLKDHPNIILYGEWLCKHSFKGYRDDAWRKFYVFDVVYEDSDGAYHYIPYDDYRAFLEEYGIDYIPPICSVTNGHEETFRKALEKNTFLVADGEGVGEGIVIKNYAYRNRFGRQTWAKMVTNEFKEKHVREMGAPVIKAEQLIEQKIVDDYCTEEFIRKEYSKLANEGWSSKRIPELLGRIFHELVAEESWNIIKALKYPTINYKALNALVVNKIKATLPEVF
jgi:hypothetical protein